MAIAAVSVAQASEYTGISSADQTTYATFLTDMLDAAATFMENYCDRRLIDGGADTALTEYVSYSGDGQTLYPNNYPIGAITSIHNDQNWNWDSTTALDSTFYRVNNERDSVVFISSELTEGTENIRIIYTAGYGATGAPTIPEDLALCTKIIFKKWVMDSNQKPLGRGLEQIASMSAEDSVTLPSPKEVIPVSAQRILDRYKKVLAL